LAHLPLFGRKRKKRHNRHKRSLDFFPLQLQHNLVLPDRLAGPGYLEGSKQDFLTANFFVMAKQDGFHPVIGTLGKTTFYKSKYGYIARAKTGITGKRLATDPVFARTRENMAEFAKAGKANKTLRAALRTLLLSISDGRMIARLTKEMMKVVKADATNGRGLRNVLDGELELLKGFDFNANSQLITSLVSPFTASIDRPTGKLSVAIDSFVPKNDIAAPAGSTHFKISSAGMEVDFEKEKSIADFQSSDVLPIDNNPTAPINLINAVTANSTHPLFIALGIEFFQIVNGQMYPLNNGAFNALSLVDVLGV
jgi:hypothetical protein